MQISLTVNGAGAIGSPVNHKKRCRGGALTAPTEIFPGSLVGRASVPAGNQFKWCVKRTLRKTFQCRGRKAGHTSPAGPAEDLVAEIAGEGGGAWTILPSRACLKAASPAFLPISTFGALRA